MGRKRRHICNETDDCHRGRQNLIEDFSNVNIGEVGEAREACITSLQREMADALADEGIRNSMNDVLELRRQRC